MYVFYVFSGKSDYTLFTLKYPTFITISVNKLRMSRGNRWYTAACSMCKQSPCSSYWLPPEHRSWDLILDNFPQGVPKQVPVTRGSHSAQTRSSSCLQSLFHFIVAIHQKLLHLSLKRIKYEWKIMPRTYCHSPTQPQLELVLDLIMGRKPPPTHPTQELLRHFQAT